MTDEHATILLDDIVFNKEIYPRFMYDMSTVKLYADAMQEGDVFPPIILRKGTHDIIDGVHRYHALLRCRDNAEDTTQYEQIPVILREYPPDMSLNDILLECSSLNTTHGKTMSREERRERARRTILENSEYDIKLLAKKLHVSGQTIRNYTSDIFAEIRAQKEADVRKLYQEGHSFKEIASRTGVGERTARRIIDKIQTLDFVKPLLPDDILINEHDVGIGQIPSLATDEQREEWCQMFELKHFEGVAWTFPQQHDQFYLDDPIIPGGMLVSLVTQLTEQRETVIDMAARNGTMLDVCKAFGRNCIAYFPQPCYTRQSLDVREHNILHHGIPETVKDAKLIFWQLPQVTADTQEQQYAETLNTLLDDMYKKASPGTSIAIYSNDLNWEKTHSEVNSWESPFPFYGQGIVDYSIHEKGKRSHKCKGSKWQITDRVLVLLTEDQVPLEEIRQYRERNKDFIRSYLQLWIGRKPE